MRCLDKELRPASRPPNWRTTVRRSYICHVCEAIRSGTSDELVLMADFDLVYHRHTDEGVQYRALAILPEGAILATAIDAVEEQLLPIHALRCDGDHAIASRDFDDQRVCAHRFFESMIRKGRSFQIADVEFDWS